MSPNDSRFWQYKVYEDIQHLCKFSLHFMLSPVYYVYNAFSLLSLIVLFVRTIYQYGCGGLWSAGLAEM